MNVRELSDLSVLLSSIKQRLIDDNIFKSNNCYLALTPTAFKFVQYPPDDQYCILSPLFQVPDQPVVTGVGWPTGMYFDGEINATLWARLAIDEVPRADEWLTSDSLGSLLTLKSLIQSLQFFEPQDANVNFLLAIPMRLLTIDSPKYGEIPGWGSINTRWSIAYTFPLRGSIDPAVVPKPVPHPVPPGIDPCLAALNCTPDQLFAIGTWEPPIDYYRYIDISDVGYVDLDYTTRSVIMEVDVRPPDHAVPYLLGQDYNICQIDCPYSGLSACNGTCFRFLGFEPGVYFVRVTFTDGSTDQFVVEYQAAERPTNRGQQCSKDQARTPFTLPQNYDLYLSCRNGWQNANRRFYDWDLNYSLAQAGIDISRYDTADNLADVISKINGQATKLGKPINVILSGKGSVNQFNIVGSDKADNPTPDQPQVLFGLNANVNQFIQKPTAVNDVGNPAPGCRGNIANLYFLSCCTGQKSPISPGLSAPFMLQQLAQGLFNGGVNDPAVTVSGWAGTIDSGDNPAIIASVFKGNKRDGYLLKAKSAQLVTITWPTPPAPFPPPPGGLGTLRSDSISEGPIDDEPIS